MPVMESTGQEGTPIKGAAQRGGTVPRKRRDEAQLGHLEIGGGPRIENVDELVDGETVVTKGGKRAPVGMVLDGVGGTSMKGDKGAKQTPSVTKEYSADPREVDRQYPTKMTKPSNTGVATQYSKSKNRHQLTWHCALPEAAPLRQSHPMWPRRIQLQRRPQRESKGAGPQQ